MTSEKIVKALRQCAKRDCSSCGMCPIFPDRECVEHLAAAAASLIECLTAENAALREKKLGCRQQMTMFGGLDWEKKK